MIPSPKQSAPRSGPPDRELMLSIAHDDAGALDLLMDRHWPSLLRYATGMIHCQDEAKDIVQEVFVRVWEHRTRWQPGGSVRGFLSTVARNLILLRGRRAEVRSRTAPQVRQLVARAPTPFETVAKSELQEAFEEAVQALPERRREAFLLVRFQGLSLREAADVMGVTRRTVANQVYRASVALQAALEPFLP